MDAWKVAGFRAVAAATLLGLASFFAVWSSTDEIKVLIIAFGTPFVGTLITRFGIEGYVDSREL